MSGTSGSNEDSRQNPLRLRKRVASSAASDMSAADGQHLIASQSVRNAVVAGLIAIIAFSAIWVALTGLSNRFFPWFTLLLGYLLGYAVRLAGRGVDWRFPLLAAVLTLIGSLSANIVVAAAYTAETFATGTWQVLRSTTVLTWPVFFDEVLNAADAMYAIAAAGLAAFFANRRLTRAQYFALRLCREEQHRD